MYSRLVIDGNAVYEIDEECVRRKERRDQERTVERKKNPYQQDKKPQRK